MQILKVKENRRGDEMGDHGCLRAVVTDKGI